MNYRLLPAVTIVVLLAGLGSGCGKAYTNGLPAATVPTATMAVTAAGTPLPSRTISVFDDVRDVRPTATIAPGSSPTPTPAAPTQVGTPTPPVIFRSDLPQFPTPSGNPASPPLPTHPAASPALPVTQSDSYNKIGFHTGPNGIMDGLGDWMRELDAAGIPFFLKSVDGAGTIYEAQEIARRSGVPHTLVFRRSGGEWELPNYNNDPVVEAEIHWNRHLAAWPSELDPTLVWMETINEPDKAQSEWLARFSLRQAELAVSSNRRYAAFSWATGEPEPEDWQTPSMLTFLRYAGKHPDHVAIALHEYSLRTTDIQNDWPYLVGRLQWLFWICDTYGIPRPTVLITEWGWEYQDVPDVDTAMAHIQWASQLYARWPEVRGAAIWYLGGGWGGIAQKAQRLIQPVKLYSLSPVVPSAGPDIDPTIFWEYYATREAISPGKSIP